MLPKKAIKEFQEIYKKECGIELTEDEAKEAGERFLSLFELLIKVDKRENVTGLRPEKS